MRPSEKVETKTSKYAAADSDPDPHNISVHCLRNIYIARSAYS